MKDEEASILSRAVQRAGDYLMIDVGDIEGHQDRSIAFVDLFQLLDSATAGDRTTARAWISKHNTAFGCPPATAISKGDLSQVLDYLKARSAEFR